MNLTGLKRKPCSLWLLLKNSHWKDKSKSRETGEEALSSSVHHIYCENEAVLSSQTPTFQEMLRELDREVQLL